jgi:hypothetical protein
MVAPGPDGLTALVREETATTAERVKRSGVHTRWLSEMPKLHLPAEHSEGDVVLAGTLAHILSSQDLYVAWSLESGQAAPVVPAALVERERAAEPEPRKASRPRGRRRRRSLVVTLLDALMTRQQRAV